MTFVPNCMVRFPPAPVIYPNVLLLMLVSGLFQAGVLTVLKLSPRNCRDSRSPILNERNTDRSIFHEPGPASALRPRFPKLKLPGCAKQFVVMLTVGSNQGARVPLPLGVAIEPK